MGKKVAISNKKRGKTADNVPIAEKENKNESRRKKLEIKKERAKNGRRDYMCKEEMDFAKLLSDLKLRIVYMDGDGNCMFRSIADQLEGNPEQHFEYRKKVMDYIDSNMDHFRLFVEDDEPFEHYVHRMRRDGEWGGHPELYAASQCLECDITIHQVGGARLLLRTDDQGQGHGAAKGHIHLSYHGEQHYNSIRLQLDTGDGPALPIRLESACDVQSDRTTAPNHPSEIERRVQTAVPWLPPQAVAWALRVCDSDEPTAIELLISDPDGYLIETAAVFPREECEADNRCKESADEVSNTSRGEGVVALSASRPTASPAVSTSASEMKTSISSSEGDKQAKVPTATRPPNPNRAIPLPIGRAVMSKKDKRRLKKGASVSSSSDDVIEADGISGSGSGVRAGPSLGAGVLELVL